MWFAGLSVSSSCRAGRGGDTWRSLQQVAQPRYAHLDAVGSTTPRVLGEYRSHDDPAMGSKEQWLRELPATLRTAMPKVNAVVYFDRLATRSRATRAPGWPTAPRSPGPVSRRLGRIRT